MPAKIPNPRKQFQFTVYIPGIDPFLCQEVKLPDVEFDEILHGDTNFDVKTAGKKKIGTLQVNKIIQSSSLDIEVNIWANQIQNTRTGGGALPSTYKREAIVEEYAPDGVTVIDRHIYSGIWPQKINGRDLSRRASENTVDSIEFSVDEIN